MTNRHISTGLAALVLLTGSITAAEFMTRDDRGRVVPIPPPTPDSIRNVWPDAEEDAFIERANHAIHKMRVWSGDRGTYGEREKNLYPMAMFQALNGNTEEAGKLLMMPDNQANEHHKHTLGIDYYWCFTLKGQMRKYFLFDSLLSSDYRERMLDAAKRWTKGDPRNTPHPVYRKYHHTKQGWGPDRFGHRQVDGRRTDNLWAMSNTSIYLMAEEAGNEATRLAALERLQDTIETWYRNGMGEWDSENYLTHTMSAYVNLYDFAKDEDVRLLAKAALDWLSMAGAVKYWRGGWAGPVKRDYGNLKVMDLNAAKAFYLYFGDCPLADPAADRDDVHHITSAYRPPMAIVAMARKQFEKPCELLVTHPTYENWKDGGRDHPDFHETTYIANTYQVGSLPRGNGGDVNGFKILMANAARGVDYVTVGHTPKLKSGTRQKSFVCSRAGNINIAHHCNTLIYLTDKADAAFYIMVPPGAQPETLKGITFVRGEKTWIAIHPISLDLEGIDAELSAKLQDAGDILSAKGKGRGLCGFAMELGESQSHGSYAAFKKAVSAEGKLDLGELRDGRVAYVGADGTSVALKHSATRRPFYVMDSKQPWVTKSVTSIDDYYAAYPTVWRNGKLFDWKAHYDPYRSADGRDAPVRQDFKSGRVRVEADGHVFEGWFDDGRYRFRNE